jgi:hypothetical protein
VAKELCPVGTMYPDINLSNHLAAVQYANYGPAEARDSNPEFCPYEGMRKLPSS